MLDTGVTYVLLIAVAFIFFFPCLWIILASLSKSGSIYSFDGFFPRSYSLATFKKLFTDTTMYNYPKWFLNTLMVATGSCILGTFLTILTAYTMSRFEFKARKPMMKITMVLGMFPSFMGMTAVYLLMTQFGLIKRNSGDQRVLVAINMDSNPYTAHFDAGCGQAKELISGTLHDFGGGSTLQPFSSEIWLMER